MLAGREELQRAVRQLSQREMPDSRQIVELAFRELGITGDAIGRDEVARDFNRLLREVFAKTLEVFERHEERVYRDGAVDALCALRSQDCTVARAMMRDGGDTQDAYSLSVGWLVKRWYPLLRALFLSVSQSRKTRGGASFELQLELLFRMMSVPFERQSDQYRVDFMMPNYDTYQKERNRALVVSVKRTLRERWQEVADELYNMRSPNVYLLTADEEISRQKQQELARRNIYLVTWDEVKDAEFNTEPMVVGFTWFANRIIPHSVALWQG